MCRTSQDTNSSLNFLNGKNKLKEISKAVDNYRLLDIETEYLTDYFQKTKEIIEMIKVREKFKLRLQQKANKSK